MNCKNNLPQSKKKHTILISVNIYTLINILNNICITKIETIFRPLNNDLIRFINNFCRNYYDKKE